MLNLGSKHAPIAFFKIALGYY